ncbi:MAG: glycosyltransferase family 4 protein [Anaerolineae bacterium]
MNDPHSIHRFYGRLRPLLRRLGVLNIARSLFSANLRERVAVRMGLGGFDQTAVLTGADDVQKTLSKQRLMRAAEVTPDFRVDGLNFIGDLRADLGIGESARLIVDAVNRVRLPMRYCEVPLRFQSRTTPLPPGLSEDGNYAFSLFHMNAPEFYEALSLVPPELVRSKYIISFWYWEVPKFPYRWHRMFNYLDELWVASRYVQGILSQVSPVPVIHMPLPIRVETSTATRRDLGLPDERFIFLFSFNPGSAVARKNPYGFIEAFRRAFGCPTSGPLLVLKVHHLDTHYGVGLEAPLRAAVESVNGVLITDNYTRLQMNNLLNLSDCYVSLHRSEGFGLGMAEAMALGKPVIATAYSANMDYMTPSNSYGVRYTLREITEADHLAQPFFRPLYEPGQVWAEPDLDHAAALMRAVYENPTAAAQIGDQARRDIHERFSESATGSLIQARLQTIADYLTGAVETEGYINR